MRRFLISIVLLLAASLAFGDSQGFNAGTGADGGGPDAVWQLPNNITIAGIFTQALVTRNGGVSNNLLATNFGFSIPVGATISGASATFIKTGSTDLSDNGIFLLKAGVQAGIDHSCFGAWTVCTTYGGSSDLWGTTLTQADVNAAGFGISIAAANGSPTFNRIAKVNAFVSMTVTFSGPVPSLLGRKPPIQYSQTRTSGPRRGVASR